MRTYPTTAGASEHRVWRVGKKNSVMQCSSDEPQLLQEAMQCQLTCEVVSSKTYVKKTRHVLP